MKCIKLKKIYYLFFVMYNVFKVTAEKFAKNCIHTIKVNKTGSKSVLWIKMISIPKKIRC